jgi:hypothetical protein
MRRNQYGIGDAIEFTGGRRLDVTLPANLNRNGYTVYAVVSQAGAGIKTFMGLTTSVQVYVSGSSSTITGLWQGNIDTLPAIVPAGDRGSLIAIRMGDTGLGARGKVIATDYIERAATTTTGLGNATGLRIGDGITTSFAGRWFLHAIYIVATAQNDTDFAANVAWTRSLIPEWHTTWTSSGTQVCIGGTSIAYGTGCSTHENNIAGLFRANGYTQTANRGMPSSQLAEQTAGIAAGLYDVFNTSGVRVLFWDYPTNGANTSNAATQVSTWGTNINTMRSREPGIIVVGTTMIPKIAADITTVVGAHNTALMANYDAHASLTYVYQRKAASSGTGLPEYIVDWRNMPGLSSHTDTGFHADGIHPNATGTNTLFTYLKPLVDTFAVYEVSIDQGATATVLPGQTLALSATINGIGVTWSRTTTSGLAGAISGATATTVTYTAPAVTVASGGVNTVVATAPDGTTQAAIVVTTPAAGAGDGGGSRRRPTRGRG